MSTEREGISWCWGTPGLAQVQVCRCELLYGQSTLPSLNTKPLTVGASAIALSHSALCRSPVHTQERLQLYLPCARAGSCAGEKLYFHGEWLWVLILLLLFSGMGSLSTP